MLTPTLDAVRLSLHILAASVWVGGQIVMLAMVPAARKLSAGAPRTLAQAFARLSWPAYGLLVATGVWNIFAQSTISHTTAWDVVLGVKLGVVAVAGISALLHSKSTSKAGLAVWGSIAGVTSVAALFMGILLAGT